MPGAPPRYRVVLVEEPWTTLPVRHRRTRAFPSFWVRRTDPMQALLEALLKLGRRGEGSTAWAPVLSEDPLTFLLDAVGDAVCVRHSDGRVAYANPAAQRLGELARQRPATKSSLEVLELGDARYERRSMTFGRGRTALIVEVLRRLA
jgi:PAS domain-containing protein